MIAAEPYRTELRSTGRGLVAGVMSRSAPAFVTHAYRARQSQVRSEQLRRRTKQARSGNETETSH